MCDDLKKAEEQAKIDITVKELLELQLKSNANVTKFVIGVLFAIIVLLIATICYGLHTLNSQENEILAFFSQFDEIATEDTSYMVDTSDSGGNAVINGQGDVVINGNSSDLHKKNNVQENLSEYEYGD